MATPYPTTITNKIYTLIEAMSAPNYYLDWGAVNIKDRALETTYEAYAKVGWDNETNFDVENGVVQSGFSNYLDFTINIRVPITTETASPNYSIRPQLYKGLEDLKKLFGNNPCLGLSNVIITTYKGAALNKENIESGDRFCPISLDVRYRVYYFQDRSNVFNPI